MQGMMNGWPPRFSDTDHRLQDKQNERERGQNDSDNAESHRPEHFDPADIETNGEVPDVKPRGGGRICRELPEARNQ